MILSYKTKLDFLPAGFNVLGDIDEDYYVKILKYIHEEIVNIFPSIKIDYREDGMVRLSVQYEEILDLFTEDIDDEGFKGFYIEDKFVIDNVLRDEMVQGEGPYFEDIDVEDTQHFKLILKYIFLQKLEGFDGREELIN